MNQEEARTKAAIILELYKKTIGSGVWECDKGKCISAIVHYLLKDGTPEAYRKITEDIMRYGAAINKGTSAPIRARDFFVNYAYHEIYSINVESIGIKCVVCGMPTKQILTCSFSCLDKYRLSMTHLAKAEPRVCSICGRVFAADNKTKKHCSPECRHEANRRINRKCSHKKRNELKAKGLCLPYTCKTCGKIYYHVDRKAKASMGYCSEECRSAALNKICENCGKPFRADKIKRRYCSQLCAGEGAQIHSYKSAIKQGKEEKMCQEKAKTAEYHDRESKKWVGVREIYDAYTKRIRPLPKGWFKYEITPLIKRILDKGYAVGDLLDAISKYELDIQNGDNIREPHQIFFGKEWAMYRNYLSSDSIRRAKELRKKGEENNSSPMPEVKLPPKEDKSMKGANEEPQPNIIESEPQPSLLEALIKEFENASLKEKLEFTSHLLPQYSDDGNTELIDAYLEAYPDNPLRHIKEDDTVIHILYGEATVIDVTDSEITVLAMSAGKHSIVDIVQRNGIKIDGSRLQRMLYADIDDLQDFIGTEDIRAIQVPVEHWLYCLKNLVEQDEPAKEE